MRAVLKEESNPEIDLFSDTADQENVRRRAEKLKGTLVLSLQKKRERDPYAVLLDLEVPLTEQQGFGTNSITSDKRSSVFVMESEEDAARGRGCRRKGKLQYKVRSEAWLKPQVIRDNLDH